MFEFLFLLGTATLALNGIRPLGLSIALSDLLYLAALCVLIANGLNQRRPVREWMPWHPLWFAAGLILVGGLISTTTSSNLAGSLMAIAKSCFLFSAWISMGLVMVWQRRQAGRVVDAFLLGAVITSVIAIIDSQAGTNLGATIFGLTDTNLPGTDLTALATIYGRYSGTLGHPNIQSEFTLVAIPIVLYLGLSAWGAAKRLKSIGLLGLLVALIWANLLTGSVSGMICVLLSIIFVLGFGLIRKLSWLFVPFFLIAANMGLIIVLVVSNSMVDPLQTLVERLEVNDNFDRALSTTGPQRFVLLGDTFSLIFENPIVGYGMDILSPDALTVADSAATGSVHNALARSWLAGGVFVFMGVAYAYFLALRLAVRALAKFWHGHKADYVFGLAVSVIVWIINDMVQPSFYQRFTWLTVALLYGLSVNYLRSSVDRAVVPIRGSTKLKRLELNENDRRVSSDRGL